MNAWEDPQLLSQACDWNGDFAELEALTTDIGDAYEAWRNSQQDEEQEEEPVLLRGAIEELLVSLRLPLFHRVQFLIFMASITSIDEDRLDKAREHIEDAFYWLQDLEHNMETLGAVDPRIDVLRAGLHDMREVMDEDEDEESDEKGAVEEAVDGGESAEKEPFMNWKRASELKEGDLGKPKTQKEKLAAIKQAQQFEKDVLEMEKDKKKEKEKELASSAAPKTSEKPTVGGPAPFSTLFPGMFAARAKQPDVGASSSSVGAFLPSIITPTTAPATTGVSDVSAAGLGGGQGNAPAEGQGGVLSKKKSSRTLRLPKSDASLGATVNPGKVIESQRLKKKKSRAALSTVWDESKSGGSEDGNADGKAGMSGGAKGAK